MRAINLFLTHLCNARCGFCLDSDNTRKSFLPREDWQSILQSRAQTSADCKLVLLGGEPSLHPDLVDIIRMGRGVGFRFIQIVTNGIRLSDPNLFDEVAGAGLNLIGLSIHGSTAETHDRLTAHQGAFKAISRLLQLAMQREILVSVNTVVTRQNLHELPDIVRWMAGQYVACMQLAFMRPDPQMFRPFEEMSSPLEESARGVEAAIEIAEQLGMPVKVEGWPMCLLGDGYMHSADSSIPDMSTVDYQSDPAERPFHFDAAFVKLSFCGHLPHCNRCMGIYRDYLAKVPTAEEELRCALASRFPSTPFDRMPSDVVA